MGEPADATYGSLFRVPGFPRLAASGVLVRTAASMWQLALVLFVLGTFQSVVLAGVAVFLSVAPGVLVSPVAGALLDRHGRARLMAIDYTLSAAALGAIIAASLGGALSAPLLLAIVALGSLSNPIGTAGGRSLFPLVVPRRLWDRANAVDSVGYMLTTIIGAPLAGVLFAAFGAQVTLAVIGALYLAAAAALVGLDDPSERSTDRHVLREAAAAVAYVARNATLRGLAVGMSTANIAHGIAVVAVPVLVLERLGGDASDVGKLWAVMGATGIVAGLVTGRLGSQGRERPILALSMLGMAAALVTLAASGSLLAVAAGMVVFGLAHAPMDVAMFSLRQRRTHPAWFGRAFAVSMYLNYSGIPLGSGISGPLIASSLTLALGVGVAFAVLAAALTYALVPREDGAREVPIRAA